MQCPCAFPLWQVWLVSAVSWPQWLSSNLRSWFSLISSTLCKSRSNNSPEFLCLSSLSSCISLSSLLHERCLCFLFHVTLASSFAPKHCNNLKPRAVLFCEPLPLQEKLSLHFGEKKKEIMLKKLGQTQQCKLLTEHLIKQQLYLLPVCVFAWIRHFVFHTKCDPSQVWPQLNVTETVNFFFFFSI